MPRRRLVSLAASIPHCTARVTPEAGHFVYSRWLAEIVGSLVPSGDLAADHDVRVPVNV